MSANCPYDCVLCEHGAPPKRGWQYLAIFLALAGWAGLIGEVLSRR